MKSYLCVVGIFCALALVKCEPPSRIKKRFEECAEEIGLYEPEGLLKRLNFDDHKVKCLQACILKKRGELIDGKVVPEKVIEAAAKHLPGGAIESVQVDINECASEANEGKDECEVGGEFHKCIIEKHPKHD